MNLQEQPSTALTAAMQQIERGDKDKAREIATKGAADAETKHGAQSLEAASAQHDLGLVLASLEDYAGAAKAFHAAVERSNASDPKANQKRLTYMLSLAGAYEAGGDLEQAEKSLNENLDARRAAFGGDHPTYAMGLEQLAGFLQRKGDLDGALDAAENAAALLGNRGHAAFTGPMVLRAEILKMMGRDEAPFEGLEEVPAQVAEDIVKVALNRSKTSDPVVSLAVLKDVRAFAVPKIGASHLATLHLLHGIAGLARALGDEKAREDALRGLIGGFDALNDQQQALEATMGLAIAQTEAGRPDEGLATLNEAAARTQVIQDRGARSRVLRNMGVLMQNTGDTAGAEKAFREAVTEGEAANNAEAMSRAQVGLGLLLQHGGRGKEAREPLAAAAAKLGDKDPDGKVARRHLEALEKGKDCGCARTHDEMMAAVSKLVMDQAPDGLLESLTIKMKGNQPDVQMNMKREPTDEELQELERLIQDSVRRLAHQNA